MRAWCRWVGMGLGLVLAVAVAHGETPSKYDMPQIVQFNFGTGGIGLPDDGLEYCAPTSATMNIAWLGLAGHTRLGPQTADTSSPEYQAYLYNLELTLAGLMDTNAYGGTNSGSILPGMETYLKMKGYDGLYAATTNGLYGPTAVGYTGSGAAVTLDDIAYAVTDTEDHLVVGTFMLGWYKVHDTVWERDGGHVPALVDAVTPNEIVINNPFPQGGFGTRQTILASEVAAGQEANDGGENNYDLGGSLNISDGMVGDRPTPFPHFKTPIIEQYFRLAIPRAVPAVATWVLEDEENVINIGGAEQDVLAPIAEASSGRAILFEGGGKLTFTETASYSGGTIVTDGGTLASTQKSGTPFGTGSVRLESSTMRFAPAGSGTDVMLQIGTAAGGEEFSYGGESRLVLDKGENDALSVTLGNGAGALQGLEPYSMLIIELGSGIAALGDSEKFLINGTAPAITNGMVAPNIMGSDGDSSGYFLTYDGVKGFQAALEVNSADVDINSAASTAIYAATTDQVVATAAVPLQAIRVQGATVSGAVDSVLIVGDGVKGGVALNGGVIATDTLDFGTSTGVVYVSDAGGEIDAVIVGEATGEGLIVGGSGELTLSQANAYAGDTHIVGATLIAANTTGSATGAGMVSVENGGTLTGSGAVAGTVAVQEGGVVTGAVDIGGSLQVYAGGTFGGNGTVAGSANIAGTLTDLMSAMSPEAELTFRGDLTMELDSAYLWVMRSYSDDNIPPIEAGLRNDRFRVEGSLTGNNAVLLLDFTALGAPNGGDDFWDDSHTWTIATAEGIYGDITLDAIPFSNGSFELENYFTDLQLVWTPVPEPSAYALIGLGVGTVWCAGRRKKRSLA